MVHGQEHARWASDETNPSPRARSTVALSTRRQGDSTVSGPCTQLALRSRTYPTPDARQDGGFSRLVFVVCPSSASASITLLALVYVSEVLRPFMIFRSALRAQRRSKSFPKRGTRRASTCEQNLYRSGRFKCSLAYAVPKGRETEHAGPEREIPSSGRTATARALSDMSASARGILPAFNGCADEAVVTQDAEPLYQKPESSIATYVYGAHYCRYSP